MHYFKHFTINLATVTCKYYAYLVHKLYDELLQKIQL